MEGRQDPGQLGGDAPATPARSRGPIGRPAVIRRHLRPLALALAFAVSTAGAPRAEGIDDVMHTALRTSLTIRADNARQEAAGYALKGSLDAFMPTVTWVQEEVLDSRIKYSPELPAGLTSGLDTYPRHEPDLHGIQVTLPLFDGFKRFNTYRAQDDLYDAGKQIQVSVRQQVLLDAASAALAVIRDRRIVALRRAYLKDLSTIEGRVAARYAVRDATITDLSLARSRVLEARAELDQSLSDLSTSTIGFTRIAGVEPGSLDGIRAPDDLVPATPEALRDCLLRQNPKLQAAELEAKAAHHAALAARAAVLPQLNLFFQHAQEDDVAPAEKHIKDTTVKLQLRVPLYEPGAFPRIGQASAEATQKEFNALDGERQADADARALFFERQSTIGQISTAGKRIAAVQQAVNGYNVELAAGYRTIIDTLNARAELTGARIALLNLEFARDKQTYTLAAALARLGPERVAAAR